MFIVIGNEGNSHSPEAKENCVIPLAVWLGIAAPGVGAPHDFEVRAYPALLSQSFMQTVVATVECNDTQMVQ